MKDIVLDITSTQRIDDFKDTTRLTTLATLEQLDDYYLIRYTEQSEPSAKPTRVSVRIFRDGKKVEMLRSGDYSSQLIIEKSNRNLCRYGTNYGDILMGIAGHNIETHVNSGEGRFLFCYDIDINGALAYENEVEMVFKNNRE